DIFPDSRHAPLDFSQRQWNFDHENSVIVVRNAATCRRFDFTTASDATEVHRGSFGERDTALGYPRLLESWNFSCNEAFPVAIGLHRLIQFTIKSGSGRGRFQLLCA